MTDRRSRSRARADWPVRIVRGRVGEHGAPPDELELAEQRLASMWELVEQAWALAGRAIPDYPRDQTPVRILRGGVTE